VEELFPYSVSIALILMGDWCGGPFADTHKRNTGRGKVLKTQTK
jgi:hypothetical protein